MLRFRGFAIGLAVGIGVTLAITAPWKATAAPRGEPSCDLPGDINGDASLNIGDAVYMLNFLFSDGPPPVPCWPAPDCPPCVVPSPGRHMDNGDGTMSDRLTGVMWQTEPAGPYTPKEAEAYVAALSIGGHSDWRLPTTLELWGLRGQCPPGWPDSGDFWGMASDPDEQDKWAFLLFRSGGDCPGGRSVECSFVTLPAGLTDRESTCATEPIWSRKYVLAVRHPEYPCPEPPSCESYWPKVSVVFRTEQTKCWDLQGNAIPCDSPNYLGQDAFYSAGQRHSYNDNGDGTITDNMTGLMWAKASSPDILTWQEALNYCEGLVLGGHDDWRLPNVNELHSIVRYDRSIGVADDPQTTIDPVFEYTSPTTESNQSRFFWSSTAYVSDPRRHWVISFGSGFVEYSQLGTRARAVRGPVELPD
ncbi:MAG: DUF1566 domain-containing protein [Planctomycetes bacterium]|nr:DUF1566 domain-containing protein [Planctomycetota bacterium]